MKINLKLLCCVIVMITVFAGCGGAQEESKNKTGYTLTVNGNTLCINGEAESLDKDMGIPTGGTYEALSCVFEGKETFYYYDGFTVQTYEKNGKKYIYAITIEDDTVKTDEGIKIGDGITEVTDTYGTSYTAEGNTYIYTKDNMTLTFVMENSKVSGISYTLIKNSK